MRLQCPQCAAKYDVDESAIPAEGREVECSNCAARWFEAGQKPLVIRRAPPVGDLAARPPAAGAGSTFEATVPPPGQLRRSVTPTITAILQEEAAFEEARRSVAEPTAPQAANSPVVPLAFRPQPQEPRDASQEGDIAIAEPLAPADISGKAEADLSEEATPLLPEAPEEVAVAYVMPRPVRPPPAAVLQVALPPAPLSAPSAPEPAADSPATREEPEAEAAPAKEPAKEPIVPQAPAAPLRANRPAAKSAADAASHQYFMWGVVCAIGIVFVLAGIYIAAPTLAYRWPEVGAKLLPYVEMIDAMRSWVHAKTQNFSSL